MKEEEGQKRDTNGSIGLIFLKIKRFRRTISKEAERSPEIEMPHFPSKVKIACYYLLSVIHASSAFSTITLKARRRCQPPSSFALNAASTSNDPNATFSPNNNPTATVKISSTLINSAIDVLEEQHFRRPDTPLDSILRNYIKRSSSDDDLQYDLDEKDALREIILGVARSQYKIDCKLKGIGLQCTPENRVIAHVGFVAGALKYPPELVNKLIKSYDWMQEFKSQSIHDDFASMDLQTRFECPDWAWPGLNEAFPTQDELTRQLDGLLQPPPLDLRVNTLKSSKVAGRDEALHAIQSAGFDNAKPTPWSPLGIRLDKRVPLGNLPGLLDGIVEPQDEGSQLVAALLNAQPGEAVADYCAGTGGKTLAIAAQMQNKGRLYSLDVDGDRLERGRPRCAKAGVGNVQRQTVQADMTRKDKWCKRRNRTFDRVLVDAPCSGVGSWRRKPDARRTWGGLGSNNVDEGVDRLKELLPLQQHILRRAARLVKPGGRLVYVTCSLLPEENEHQIEEFLKCDEGEVVGWKLDAPADFVVPFEAGNGHYLRLTPAQHGTDGFFAAVLRRDEEN
eukprot:CAMPEP_0201908530 /NCGR_PEP_ID=MMETSP0903-20130614/620_1 /ASSEMBLY_ACC=CAM_ASM_000552 /TAXON_ID=420261 /ORGANISM="Thalassiosira antarctica, Strain CCMP982" /LENGTH=563 /DNA_ID=CAMNT_0048442893 /DNA_START=120 /DNA_END=1811 /DNA_ORIENTATION=-